MNRSALLSVVIAAAILGAGAGYGIARMDSHSSARTDHAQHVTGSIPVEAGQGAFAAVAEIVSILTADPKTDWSKVDISALREHLADMNELSLADLQALEKQLRAGPARAKGPRRKAKRRPGA